MGQTYTVFYMNPGATEDVCRVVREQMPSGWRLLTPSGGDPAAELAE